ncbi:MAG: hypothetical protein ACJ8C4_15440 [Gemmataceae bacterium]
MLWKVLAIVALAGAAGGFGKALIGDAQLILPEFIAVGGQKVFVPGFIGNLVIGALAACLSFALYGPLNNQAVMGAANGPAAHRPSLTLSALAGAALVGFTGGSWVTAEANERLNHATARVSAEMAQKAEQNQLGAGQRAAEVLEALKTKPPIEAYRTAEKASR